MQKRLTRVALVTAVAAILSACEGTTGTVEEDPQAGATPVPVETGTMDQGASTTGVGTDQGMAGNPLDDPASLLATRTIFFEFDSSEIQAQDRETINAHGDYLRTNPGASITLEGHADERGTREYNVALGERRATSVRDMMLFAGASEQQIRTISYGEERPAAEGQSESAWSLNRRVEVIYRTR